MAAKVLVGHRRWLPADLGFEAAHALRTLLARPRTLVLSALLLGLGLGANIAVLSVLKGVLFADLPYRDSERLFMVWTRQQSSGDTRILVSWPDFRDMGSALGSAEQLAALRTQTFAVTSLPEPVSAPAIRASPNLLSLLGVRVLSGRDFRAEDARADAAPVAMVSERFCRLYLGGGRCELQGRMLTLDGQTYEIVGVVPRVRRARAHARHRDRSIRHLDSARAEARRGDEESWPVLGVRTAPRRRHAPGTAGRGGCLLRPPRGGGPGEIWRCRRRGTADQGRVDRHAATPAPRRAVRIGTPAIRRDAQLHEPRGRAPAGGPRPDRRTPRHRRIAACARADHRLRGVDPRRRGLRRRRSAGVRDAARGAGARRARRNPARSPRAASVRLRTGRRGGNRRHRRRSRRPLRERSRASH